MQAILTKKLPCTNTRPSRMKASCQAGSLTVSYAYDLNIEENHERACALLIAKLGWSCYTPSKIVCGQLPDGTYAHVFKKD